MKVPLLAISLLPILAPHIALAHDATPQLVVEEEKIEEPPSIEGAFLPWTPPAADWADTELRAEPVRVVLRHDVPVAAETPPVAHPVIGVGHLYPRGQCTWYVASHRLITFGGNAREWLGNARAAGYTIGSRPQVGAVVVRSESRYGHVALVEAIHGDTMTISESNVRGLGVISQRTVPINSSVNRGYIL